MNVPEPKTSGKDAENTCSATRAERFADGPFVVLLVEDEKTDAYLVKWALEENRLNVDLRRAFDGHEALAYLRRLAPRFADVPRPDLILLDLNMPCIGGLECLATIKQDQALSDIRVVMLSTSCAEADVLASRDLGAADYFCKPMGIRQLAETFRILGERWITPHAAAPAHDNGSAHERNFSTICFDFADRRHSR